MGTIMVKRFHFPTCAWELGRKIDWTQWGEKAKQNK